MRASAGVSFDSGKREMWRFCSRFGDFGERKGKKNLPVEGEVNKGETAAKEGCLWEKAGGGKGKSIGRLILRDE